MIISQDLIGQEFAFLDRDLNTYCGVAEKIENDQDWAYGSYKIIPKDGANFSHLRIFYYAGKRINYTVRKIGQTERREEQCSEPMVRGIDPISFSFIFDE